MKDAQSIDKHYLDKDIDRSINDHYIRIKVRKHAVIAPVKSGHTATHLHPDIDNLLRHYDLLNRVNYYHESEDRNGDVAVHNYRLNLLDKRPIPHDLIRRLETLDFVEEVTVHSIPIPPYPKPRHAPIPWWCNSKWMLIGLLLGALALIPLLWWLIKSHKPKPPVISKPASTFFVNPATGNDANSGQAGAPFQTLSHALEQAGAKSTIYLAREIMVPINR